MRGAWAQDEPYRDLVCSYPWPCQKAVAVMLCESTGDALVEKQGNRGLFQINVIHRAMVGGDVDLLFDPEINVRVAYELWAAQGWTPWKFCGR